MVDGQQASPVDLSIAGKGDVHLMYTIITKAIK